MTREGGTLRLVIAPLRMGKAPLTCHCEAPQEPWQSRSTRRNTGKPRRIRRCLLEIATSGLRPPRNDTGGRHSQACHCAPPGGESPPDLSLRGSAGAAAISQYTPGTQESPGEFDSACLRFPRRFAPRNDTGGRHSQACHCAPPDGESPPDLSLRGSAGAVAISQYSAGSWESHRRNRNCLQEIPTSLRSSE